MNASNNIITVFIFTLIFPISIFGLRINDLSLLMVLALIPFIFNQLSFKKNINNFLLVSISLSTICLYLLAIYNDFDLANLDGFENQVGKALSWLILDRDIGSFFSAGNSYRNSLIYFRYILIPLYFFVGWWFFKNKKNPVESILNIFIIASLLHLLLSLYGYATQGGRQSGMFNNPAELSIIGLMLLLFSKYSENRYKKILGYVISLILILLSFTFSAFLALFGFVLLSKIKALKVRLFFPFVIIISYLLATDISSIVSSEISKYLYVGSLMNRFNLWVVFKDIFSQDIGLYFMGFGSFPVFADNIFWYLMSGLGFSGWLILLYLYKISYRNEIISSLIVFVILQGVLFPGLIMPYFISLLFFIIGFFYFWEGCNVR
ncbi:conserved membrane hypothetical protein [Vibrio chagasii]|nr:conserved membrane hypothetical protein [Vibrio chagasii]